MAAYPRFLEAGTVRDRERDDIWDMIDQGIQRTTADGETYFAYGEDFGDVPNDGNLCFNGDFASDRTPNPSIA